jgi:hypothetical protein
MARRTYTEEARRDVLADVPALGVREAASKHGVPPTTVQSWIDLLLNLEYLDISVRPGVVSLVLVFALARLPAEWHSD